MIVQLQRLDPRALMPKNAYGDDAGWDLHVLEDTAIPPGSGVDVRTGVAVAIPPGFFGRIVGRSSAFRRKGLMVMEGIIDCGFRGELFSYVYNPGDTPEVKWLSAGESVAQLIVQPVPLVTWREVDKLPDSTRGSQGFGSSGR